MAYTYKAVDPESGIKWCVRAVFIGDKYGRDDCLTYGDREDINRWVGTMERDDNPLIEFYDMDSSVAKIRADDDKLIKERGQFVSRYYLDTLNKTDWSQSSGLNLEGSVDRWSVSGDFMVKAMDAVNIETDYAKRVTSKEVEDA